MYVLQTHGIPDQCGWSMDCYHRGHTGLVDSHLSVLSKQHVSHTLGKLGKATVTAAFPMCLFISDELPSQLLQNKDSMTLRFSER